MRFQRSSEGIEGKSRPPQSGWKIVPQSRTDCRETPVAKFVVCLWHEQLPDVIEMRPQRNCTDRALPT